MATLAERAKSLRPSASKMALDSVGPVVLAIGLTLLLHFVVGPAVGHSGTKILLDMGINIVLAVSLNMVNGFTGQFSIGHAGFMAIGGYTAGIVTYYGGYKLFGTTNPTGGFLGAGQWLFALSCIAGAVTSGFFGYLVGLPSLRLKGDYLALVTLGFGEIVCVLLTQSGAVVPASGIDAVPAWQLPYHVGGAVGFSPLPFYTNLFWVYLFVCITVLFAYRLKESNHGRALLSIREDEIAAEASGIAVTPIKVRAFAFSAAFAGVAGGLYFHLLGALPKPGELGFQKSFEIIIMVVLGGMGSVSGTILAAIVLTILPEVLREFSDYRMVVYALALVLMMLVRPQGLFGIREIWELGRERRKKARGSR